jgi:hypothetical protein
MKKVIRQKLKLIVLLLVVISFIVTITMYHNMGVAHSNMRHRGGMFRNIALNLHVYSDMSFSFSKESSIQDANSDFFWLNGLTAEDENSWRFYNIAMNGTGSDSEYYLEKIFNSAKLWNEHPNITARPISFCWTGEPSSESYYWTNIMTLKGKDTVTDLLKTKCKRDWNELKDLIVLVEVSNSRVHWGCPGDLDIENLPPNFLRGTDGKGLIVMFADWQIWYISCNVPLETLKHFLVTTDLKNHSRDIELKPYTRVYK